MTQLATDILTTNILPYWLRMKDPAGGYYGAMTLDDLPDPTAERGVVLNARILWTFSAAYRVLHNEVYRQAAEHAYAYFVDHFLDLDYGGVYWSLRPDGVPKANRKQTYAIAFAIYALSEYYTISGDRAALDYACGLYRDIEDYALDTVYGGYVEALAQDWTPLADMRLSEKDNNAPKSQNTHLHILEAYTALYRSWPSDALRGRIESLITIFSRHMIDPVSGHLDLYFADDWTPVLPRHQSYGHEIEASWLIDEAAEAIDIPHDQLVLHLAAVAAAGLQADGSMVHEDKDPKREWWVEAEAVVGYTNIYRRFGDSHALQRAQRLLDYIHTHLLDHEHGEWYWDCDADGLPNRTIPKAGFWKCPYHNSRMCLEIINKSLNS